MQPEAPDKRFYAEVRDLNLEFLGLVADARVRDAEAALLGLEPGVVAAVRRLDGAGRRFVAGAPVLLAGFSGLPRADGVDESTGTLAPLDPAWVDAARVFSAGLLTYLSQLVHRDRLGTSLCVGSAAGIALDDVSLREVLASSAVAVGYLRARFSRRPGIWLDLLRAAGSADGTLRKLCRLRLVPLGLAEPPLMRSRARPAAMRHC